MLQYLLMLLCTIVSLCLGMLYIVSLMLLWQFL